MRKSYKSCLRIGGLYLATMLGTTSSMAQTIDVLHYWTSGGEATALKTIADAYQKRGGTWKDSAVTGSEAQRASLLTRVAGGEAPGAAVVSLGEVKDLATQGLLAPIGDLPSLKDQWPKLFPPLLGERVSVDNELYALPVDLGTSNWLWYSKKIFDEVGVKPPATWDEFFTVADAIKAKGYLPLAFGGQAWQEALVFRTILIGQGGPDFYRIVYSEHNAEAASGETMIKAFQTFGRLRDYVDEGVANRNWNDATGLVIADKAGMQIMGDWAKGEFLAAGKKADVDYGCAISPGANGALEVSVDAIVFPKGENVDVKARDKLAGVIIAPEVQIAFNLAKGAVPPVLNVDMKGFDGCSQKVVEQLGNPKALLPSSDMSFTASGVGDIRDLVTEFWDNRDMKPEDAATRFGEIVANDK
ncbi:hypothetical protein DSM25558_3296 [Agrobacterium sp. DSM 25558]|uniref:ABC transporter substrate-binding protein n=1 Tax=Agrobacterium sp. DSM 25558 TaxID=1907665 RepID=UPI0009726205|nr:ABC transporter substrate-binding protein [Agrobacterium sp. DSM 25558]SCX23102.1 hypothetical protein DSM25558_3296 [Agrobacterium sp. DSM 25558]